MNTSSFLRVALATALVSAASLASASIITEYSFGNPGDETTNETSPAYNPTITAPNASGSAITDPLNKVGLEISSAATTPAGAPFLRLDPQGNATSDATAIGAGTYFSFTVNANAGNELDLTSLALNAARGGGGTPRGYDVRSSIDNFGTTLGTADLLTARPTYTPVSIDLSGASFQHLSTLTFHIYSYSPAAGSSVDYDDITLNGAVTAVPEPATLVSLLIGVGGCLCWLRRPGRR